MKGPSSKPSCAQAEVWEVSRTWVSETFVVKTKVRPTCLWEHWLCLSLGWGRKEGTDRECLFFAGFFFSFFRWKVSLCCSVIASGGKSFPTLQQKYAWQGEKCYKSSTSYSWFSAKVKSFWEQLQLVKFFSRLEATLTLRAEETFCYLQELHKWHVWDFFFCLDTVKLGPWSSQTQAGARRGPCCHSKAKGLL